ncbi:glycerol kinase GlpK [Candidatus Laterigemmans baculatus]|uniref:glycerol kinase GlpK n=1 Tax=Candidatus Laterigemmans baculatus TaxID=2770505 RepID=UPI0013DC928F|nr:glycerol kinase GlpK [Candidatus Laterigemmans baculatus]
MSSCILALDQGTTSSRAMLFSREGRVIASAQQEFEQIYPVPGHVEHDPEAIWSSVVEVAREALRKGELSAADVAAIGVTNQRETVVLWERATGRPVGNAIVWQSRVSAPICDKLKAEGLEPLFRDKTGLVIDAYFSGTKIKHVLDSVAGLRERAERGEILVGTVDSYLVWRLTGGRLHLTDVTNACRTLLFNIHTLDWDDELLRVLDVPRAMLPEVRSSSEVYGETDPEWFGGPIPIAGIAGDQQAATFGQACFERGSAKNTYGTGCFVLMNTGEQPIVSEANLLTTILWSREGQVTYGLEGAIFIAGAIVQWLRDGLKVIESSEQVEALAASVPDSGGVYLVPALVGLGAPHWDPYARGSLFGLTRGTEVGHIARAAVESMAFQTRDVLEAMQQDSGLPLAELKVDGGASLNNALMQFQADLLDVPVRRPVVSETTALGAAYLAGLAVGYWNDLEDVRRNWTLDREFRSAIAADHRDQICRHWKKAVSRSLDWLDHA